MAAQIEIEIDLTKINKDLINTNLRDGKTFNRKNGGKTVVLKVTVQDETKYGNNVRVNQPEVKGTDNERGEIIGNGRVYWTDGKITLAERENKSTEATAAPADVKLDDDDLPF